MAIYHLSVKTISRSAGRSATAAASYRTAEKIIDERTGEIHDYSRRSGVVFAEIFLPEYAPEWATNREALWNAAELAETRKNSTVAREFVVALPAELNETQRAALVREFAQNLVNRHGMAVDAAVHRPGKAGDDRNHHAHLLCSTRRLTVDGFKNKTRELDVKTSGEVEHWRSSWSALVNRHLEKHGHETRVDHRSLEVQGIERIPTRHLGPAATAMVRRGYASDRGDQCHTIVKHNAEIINLAQEKKHKSIDSVQLDREIALHEYETKRRPSLIYEREEYVALRMKELASQRESRRFLANIQDQAKGRSAPLPRKSQAVTVETAPSFAPASVPIKNPEITDRVQIEAKRLAVRTEWEKMLEIECAAVEARVNKEISQLERDLVPAPPAPTGLFARFKQGQYTAQLEAWRMQEMATKNQIENLHMQLPDNPLGQWPNNAARAVLKTTREKYPDLYKQVEKIERDAFAENVEKRRAREQQRTAKNNRKNDRDQGR